MAAYPDNFTMNESRLFSNALSEQRRLAKLHSMKLLDTPREVFLDELTTLACEITSTPIAALSLIDTNRQWFKSAVGLEVSETPRVIAFCDYTIRNSVGEFFVVADALKDVRFAQNPLVLGKPHIRFYAGLPIVMSTGEAIGSLCVIARQPRELSALQTLQLQEISEYLMSYLAVFN